MEYLIPNPETNHSADLENLLLGPIASEDRGSNETLKKLVVQRRRKKEGPLEQIFSSKRKTLKASVIALLEEIKNREDLKGCLLDGIENEIGSRSSYLDRLKALNVHYIPEIWKEINKAKMRLEENLLELEREKRKEHLECWRDLMFLRKYLLSALREYWDLVKRSEILEGEFD